MDVTLRPYQVEACEAINREWKDHDRTLLVLPTGCGKTICFATIAKERAKSGRVLILAHREELLTQAADKLLSTYEISSVVEKAESSCIGAPEQVVVGSVQTLQGDKRLAKFPADYFKTIIIDEAHHALAEGYKKVLQHFGSAKVLGVTATPDRGDMKNLGEYFESLAYEYSLREAVKSGYLSPIRVQTMPLNIDMTGVKMSQGDYSLGEAGHALEPYLEDIADEMAKVCLNRHTVVFLPLVNISQQFRDILNRKGFKAAEVNGESKDREVILNKFANGEFNVLCNSMLLTEGWDCPIVDCVVILRPTKVRGLYCQMIGRGTRLYPGKNHLLVLDFLWMTGKHQLIHPADIICKSEENAKAVTQKLQEGSEADLFAVEHDVEQERKDSLRKALEEAEKRRKEKKLIDPLEYELSINADDLVDFVPTFGWECEPATDKQISYLERLSIDARNMNKGQAKQLIDRMSSRMDQGLSTPKQIKLLSRMGFQRVAEWTKDEAARIIAELAAVDWKIWRCRIDAGSYLPASLKREETFSWM